MRLIHIFLLVSLLFSTWMPLIAQEKKKADEGAPVEEVQKNPFYVDLAPSFISNLAGATRYMRCDITLLTYEETFVDDIELHAPALRHALFLLLGDQKKKDISSKKGREKLRQKALKVTQEVMQEMVGRSAIDNLFFDNFFVE